MLSLEGLPLLTASALEITIPERSLFRIRIDNLSGRRIEYQRTGTPFVIEIEQAIHRSSDRVRRAATYTAEVPVVLHEPYDRRLIGYSMIDVVPLGERRDD